MKITDIQISEKRVLDTDKAWAMLALRNDIDFCRGNVFNSTAVAVECRFVIAAGGRFLSGEKETR